MSSEDPKKRDPSDEESDEDEESELDAEEELDDFLYKEKQHERQTEVCIIVNALRATGGARSTD